MSWLKWIAIGLTIWLIVAFIVAIGFGYVVRQRDKKHG